MALTERDRALVADLQATFPGIWTRDAAEFRSLLYPCGVQVGTGEHAEMGGLPIFSDVHCSDPDEYDGFVLHAFKTWIANRGYVLLEHDPCTYFAVPVQSELLGEPA